MNKYTAKRYQDEFIKNGYKIYKNGIIYEIVGAASLRIARRIVRIHCGQSIKFFN